MAVKMQFGRLASIGKLSSDGKWVQTFLSPSSPDGQIMSSEVVRAYADKDMLLSFGQICAYQAAKKGDKTEIFSDVTLNGSEYKKGDMYTYDSDSTRIVGVGMTSIAEIQKQLDRLVKMPVLQLPTASEQIEREFHLAPPTATAPPEIVEDVVEEKPAVLEEQ